MNRKLTTIIVSVAATASLGLGAGGAVTAASASTVPVVYGRSWMHPQAGGRQYEVTATDGSVFAVVSSWSHWNGTSAYGRGTIWGQDFVWTAGIGWTRDWKPGAYKYTPVGVTFSVPKTHNGAAYFSRMTWSFWLNGKHYTEVFSYSGVVPPWPSSGYGPDLHGRIY